MATHEATLDPESPEGIIAIQGPQFDELCTERNALSARAESLRAEILVINTEVMRTMIKNPHVHEVGAELRATEDRLLFVSGCLENLAPRVRAARGAVAVGGDEVTRSNMAIEETSTVLAHLVDEQQAAQQARDTAMETGTAEELHVAERRLRQIVGGLVDAQREYLGARVQAAHVAHAQIGREQWNANRRIADAVAGMERAREEHALAQSDERAIALRRAELEVELQERRRELASLR